MKPDFDRSAHPVVGGLYVFPTEGRWGIAKVLKVEDGIVYIRQYKNKFDTLPVRVDPASLSLGTIHDQDGFGMGHLPIRFDTFVAWKAEFLQHTLVEIKELEGYEIWKESGGGAW